MSPHSDTLSWLRTNQSLLLSLMLRSYRRSNKYNILNLWFDPIRSGTHNLPHFRQVRYINHYTTNVVVSEMKNNNKSTVILLWIQKWIVFYVDFHTYPVLLNCNVIYTSINLWIYVGTPPTSSFPPQAIQHSFFSASLATLDVFYTIYTLRLDTSGNPGILATNQRSICVCITHFVINNLFCYLIITYVKFGFNTVYGFTLGSVNFQQYWIVAIIRVGL
jgi:hypothetical protein